MLSDIIYLAVGRDEHPFDKLRFEQVDLVVRRRRVVFVRAEKLPAERERRGIAGIVDQVFSAPADTDARDGAAGGYGIDERIGERIPLRDADERFRRVVIAQDQLPHVGRTQPLIIERLQEHVLRHIGVHRVIQIRRHLHDIRGLRIGDRHGEIHERCTVVGIQGIAGELSRRQTMQLRHRPDNIPERPHLAIDIRPVPVHHRVAGDFQAVRRDIDKLHDRRLIREAGPRHPVGAPHGHQCIHQHRRQNQAQKPQPGRRILHRSFHPLFLPA